MNWQYTSLVFPLLVAAAISIGLAFYSWQRRPAAGVMPFTLLMLAVALWALGDTLRLVSTDLPAKFFWARFRYLGIVVVPAAWLVFALQYTGQGKWLTPRNIAMLTIEPLVTLLLVWTNEAHHLIWSDIRLEPSGSLLMWSAPHGVAFWVHAGYSYLLFLLGTFLLLQALIRSPRLYRVQIGVLIAGALAPLVGNVLSTSGLVSFPLDMTPFAFIIAGLAVAWDVCRFRLFNIVPAARSAVVDSMSGGVLVLDVQNHIVDINPAAQDILGRPASDVVGHPASQVLADRLDLLKRYCNVTEAHTEITLGEGKTQRSYDLRLSPLHDQGGHFSGRLMVLHDITEHKRTEANLMAQKQWFENLVAMARATAKHTSLEATLQSAVNMAATLTGAEHGSMFLLDGMGAVTHSVLARGEAGLAHQQSILREVMGEGLAGWVVRQRQPALVHDTSRDDRWTDLAGTPAARSAMAIPIVSGSAVLGVLTLTHSKPNHFSTEHAYLIQASADQMMLAVRNAQMYDEQRRLADRQTTLYEALRTVGEHLDPETIAHAAVRAVARLTGWPAVAIVLPEDPADGAPSHLVVQAGAGALSAAEDHHLPVDQDITGRAFQTAQTQHVPDLSAEPDYVSGSTALRSKLAVPLRRGERVLGVLDVASDRPAAFNDDDVLLAKSLAEAIALALDNARLYAEIRQYAADLSALYNVARAISRSLVLEDVLSETLHSALTSLSFDAGIISLADLSDGHLYLAAERGLPTAISTRLREEGLEGTLCAYVHSRGEAMAMGDIEQESPVASELEREAPLALREMSDLGMRAYSGISLSHQERSLGTLSLFARQPRALSAEDQALQMAIGQQIATAVTNARLFQAIEDEGGRLRALIESSRDGIILIGMDQRILVANAPGIDLLRLTGQPEDWVNQSVQDALNVLGRHAPDVVQVIQAEMHRVRTGDALSGEGEWEIPPRTIHWLNLPVMAGTTRLGRLLVLRDVTEERLLERMRDDLIHAMVHDLRNPLTVISGALSFLDEDMADLLPANHLELWEIAKKSTKGMLELIKAILEMSRLESRQIPLEHTLISLDNLITGTLDSQLPLAAEKGLRLESDVPPALPPAWADAALIERVLQNLISNAIKFTSADGVVRVTVRTDKSERSRFLVSVSDTGSGIVPEIQDRLFQKFVTGRQEGHGSGLGLAFCKMVVEAHGERIWVESTSESGTTFTFTLPLPPALES
jgi:PAS domain S-box-containing protein